MRKYISFALWSVLAATVVAQQPARARRVWTNDDFAPTQEAPKPQAKAPLTAAVAARAPKTLEEANALLELRTQWLSGLRATLDKTRDEVMHATSQEQRHALVTKIKVIERDIEDSEIEVRDLESKLSSMKTEPKVESRNTAESLPGALHLEGMRR